MGNFSVSELLKGLSDSVPDETRKYLEENKDFLEELGKKRVAELMHYVTNGDKDEAGILIYQEMLHKLSDEDFLNIKKHNIEGLRKEVELKEKRKKLVEGLFSKIGKIAGQLLLNQIIFLL